MNFTKENIPAFVLENKDIELFKELEALGVYTYVKMLIEHETTTVPIIIERIVQHFGVTEADVLDKIKIISDMGLLFIARKQD